MRPDIEDPVRKHLDDDMTAELCGHAIPESHLLRAQGPDTHGDNGLPVDRAVHLHTGGFQIRQPAEKGDPWPAHLRPPPPVGHTDTHGNNPGIRITGKILPGQMRRTAGVIDHHQSVIVAENILVAVIDPKGLRTLGPGASGQILIDHEPAMIVTLHLRAALFTEYLE